MPFLWGPDGDGHLFWDCPFPPLVAIRESPEFHDVVSLDKSFWPRCLLWHGWLPALSGSDFGSPWAEGADAVASKRLEVALGSYVVEGYRADHDFLIGGDPRELAAAPDVWSDGSLVVHEVSGIGVAGCGVYAHASGAAWFGRKWGIWTCSLLCLIGLVKLVGCTVLFLALYRRYSVLRFGVFWLPCKDALGCTLVLITLMWLIIWLALLLVGVLVGLFLW